MTVLVVGKQANVFLIECTINWLVFHARKLRFVKYYFVPRNVFLNGSTRIAFMI